MIRCADHAKRFWKPFFLSLIAFVFAFLINPAYAATFQSLYSFAPSDGGRPLGLVLDQAGSLYGVTFDATDKSPGTVYRIDPATKAITTLYSFTDGADGGLPQGSPVFDKSGALYGTTDAGGLQKCFGDCGVVFKLTPPSAGQSSWAETVVHAFTGTDGGNPNSLVFDASGALYGTVVTGNTQTESEGGYGGVFKLTPPSAGHTAWTETLLHTFTGGKDGRQPLGALIIDQAGALYGVTNMGGNISACNGYGCGVVYKLTPPGAGRKAWTETELYSFAGGSDGSEPAPGLVMDASGALYGATNTGGANNAGMVFKLVPPTAGKTKWARYVVLSFKGGASGVGVSTALIMDKAGALYGASGSGGSAKNCPSEGCAVIFKLPASVGGGTFRREVLLHAFARGPAGYGPNALIIDTHGTLFGTTYAGGSQTCSHTYLGCGTVFSIAQ